MTPNNTTPLPEEVKKEIREQATKWASGDNFREWVEAGMPNSHYGELIRHYTAGATGMWHQSQQQIADLERWKEEATFVMDPILTWGQSPESSIGLGKSIMEEVLRRAKEYHSLEQRAAKLVEALEGVIRYERAGKTLSNTLSHTATIAKNALSQWNSLEGEGKGGSDE